MPPIVVTAITPTSDGKGLITQTGTMAQLTQPGSTVMQSPHGAVFVWFDEGKWNIQIKPHKPAQ
jgi:hypothetical protein